MRLCEEARDRVIEWCVIHNPLSKWESWRSSGKSAKIVTELLRRKTGEENTHCSRELWEAAICVRDEQLIPAAACLGEERGQRIWTTCIMQKEEVELCFQGIQSTGLHQSTMMLKEAGVEASEEEWAKCTVKHRRLCIEAHHTS